MSLTTFTDTLRAEVSFLQAAYPEREGDIARAHAAIIEGHVIDTGDGNGRVLSRDGHTWHTTNGRCTCAAAEFDKPCRHLSAWKLFKHVAAKHAQLHQAQPPEPAPTPAPPMALGEAPASVNVRLTLAGREIQLTLRDTDERRLLARLADVLRDYPMGQTPVLVQTSQTRPPTQDAPVCPYHGRMKRSKFNDSWYCSARMGDGSYCQEKQGDQR